MAIINTRSIVFITGAFVTSACWDEWRVYFERRAFQQLPHPGRFAETLIGEVHHRQGPDGTVGPFF